MFNPAPLQHSNERSRPVREIELDPANDLQSIAGKESKPHRSPALSYKPDPGEECLLALRHCLVTRFVLLLYIRHRILVPWRIVRASIVTPVPINPVYVPRILQ